MHTSLLGRVVPTVSVLALLTAACSIDDQGSGSSDDGGGGEFTVNTENCPDPEAVTAEIGDTIKIGWSAALSGPVAATQVRVNRGIDARLKLYNESQKDIGGRTIDFQMKDDGYDPQKAKQNVAELIQRDKVDILGAVGGGQLAAVVDDQNEACVPLLNSQVGSPEWRDVELYPWTTSYLPRNDMELIASTQLIENEVEDPKVVVVYQQTESGTALRDAFDDAAEGTDLEIVDRIALTTPSDAASSARESGANVLFNATIGADCLSVPEAVARAGFEPELLIQPSACADAKSIYQAGGEAMDGAILFAWTVQGLDPAATEDEDWAEYAAAVEAIDGDPQDNYTILGWSLMDIIIGGLIEADASEDGLTRKSIIEVAQTLQYEPSMFRDGIPWSMSPETGNGINKLQPLRWNAAEGAFDPMGDALTLEAD
ncbi:hypothetical protein BHE97_16350 [Aeromicrobium sp. PE09-221]|uniref:ABC transporter substrate-binding protein n=1 Tax=Aeromicrobium sp. PE09-221 TaxID=1898043 RepID=UPI000B3EC9FC|nr:ABC transporter substrate-binding protein [Aeromicrobium sp. PE09-221]OUZ07665.1 hypothetical protein BHE97_16350 [Aeromicrobium sp. PE09-221]